MKELRYFAIFGNGMYILWILYNGADEGFQSTPIHTMAYIGILVLLALDIVLLYGKKE